MTLPTSGPISLSQVNTENGFSTAAIVSLNDNSVRSLAGKITGQIGFSDLLGKSNDGIVAGYYFNGTNTGIRLATSNTLVFGTNDFTVEFWLKANNTQTPFAMIIDSSVDNTGLGVGIGANNGTPGKLTFWAQGGTSTNLVSANNVTDNVWHHVACVKFANTGMLFVDGVKTANSNTGEWSTVTNAYLSDGEIGRSRFGDAGASDNLYTGWLSNLRVARRAIYTQNFTRPNRVLAPIPNTTLLTLRSATIVDDSGNNLTLTANTELPSLTLDVIPPITATYPVNINTNITNANVYTLAVAAGWDANNGLVVATVNTGVIVSSTSTGAYAMEINGGFYGGVKLVNNGTIIGRGGNGGAGGSASVYTSGTAGTSGTSGGPALLVGRPTILKNAGRISGGGGGGGAGGSSGGFSYYTYYYTSGKNTYAATGTYYYSEGGGGGGGGIGASVGGTAGAASGTTYPRAGAAGAAGTTAAAGAGGAGGAYGYNGGAGGSGGTFGSSGAAGGTGNANQFNAAAGAAGTAGTAIQGYSKITIQSIGTINGTTSG